MNGNHRSYRDSLNNDSPSHQLWEEFNRLVVDEDTRFKRSLDSQAAEQEKLHREALDQALKEHEAVRQSAERVRERLELEIKRERLRREDEEKRAVEKARRDLAEQEAEQQRRQLDDAKRYEEERKQREALKREQEEQKKRAEAQRQREEQEKVQRKAAQDKEEADRKAREDAAARERQQQAQKPAPPPLPSQQQPNGVAPSTQPPRAPAQPAQPPQAMPQPQAQPQLQVQHGEAASRLISSTAEREAEHKRYMDLWKRLKVMRKSIEDQCKQAGFKELGELRRDIRKRLGQLNKIDKRANLETVSMLE